MSENNAMSENRQQQTLVESGGVRIDLLALRNQMITLGHSGEIDVQLVKGLAPGEYYQEQNEDGSAGKDIVCLNPHFIVIQRLGLIPLLWPSAWCPRPLFKKKLLQTLTHELRHALQTAGATPLDPNATPKLSYTTIQWIGRGYILLALLGLIAIQKSIDQNAPMVAISIGGVLVLGAIVFLTLAYINYHLDPAEVDARAYERSDWQAFEGCVTLV
jgi:hypothetical protein